MVGRLGTHEQWTKEITKEQYDRCWNKGDDARKRDGYPENDLMLEIFGQDLVYGYGVTTSKAYKSGKSYYLDCDASTYCD